MDPFVFGGRGALRSLSGWGGQSGRGQIGRGQIGGWLRRGGRILVAGRVVALGLVAVVAMAVFEAVAGAGLTRAAAADPVSWNSRAVAAAGASRPAERYNHAMAYDAVHRETVLFGGYSGVFGVGSVGDTWSWNGSEWRRRDPADGGPSARELHAMAFDESRGVTVLFGGVDSDGVVRADLWEYNGSNWTQRSQGATAPTGRYGHTMVYDSVGGVVLLFGGTLADGTLSDELWQWDGSEWALMLPRRSAPSGRTMHAMAFDSGRGVTVLHGGRGAAGLLDDTWEWSGSQWRSWTGQRPAARCGHAMAYDSVRAVTVMVGGNRGDSLASSEVWQWDGAAWVPGAAATWRPPAGFGRAMAFDVARGRAVLMGGLSGMTLTSESWELGKPCSAPAWDVEPIARRVCGSTMTSLSVVPGTTGRVTFQWWKDGVAIDPAVNPSAGTDILLLAGGAERVAGRYDCVMSNECGTSLSGGVVLPLGWCVCSTADVAGGGVNGLQPDGNVDGTDFVAFINGFAGASDERRSQADIAGGGENGDQPDGVVDGTDFIAFINAFSSGC